jgi:hypothetical protein
MTTHETDRPADYDPVDENLQVGGSDDPTDEQYDGGSDTDADVTDASIREPVDDAVDEDSDEVEDTELEPEAEPDGSDAVAIDRTPGSDPMQKLAPVGPETALDPGTGRYEDRWAAIQAGFIDDPRRTVESASTLVAEVWDETVRTITHEREGVDGRWQSTESSTDDLREVMQEYRALYTRYVGFTSD